MLAGKPQENVVRAIGAFYQLSEIIKVLAGARALTPDEEKFLDKPKRATPRILFRWRRAIVWSPVAARWSAWAGG